MSNGEPSRWGATLFCDDIRTEVGNKITLVGIYGSDLIINSTFPYVFPKFAFWINLFESPSTTANDGKIVIFLPGDESPSIEAEVPLGQLRSDVSQSTDDEDQANRRILLKMPIVVAPLILKQPGRIRVRMHIGDEIIRLGTLPIRAGEPVR